MSDLILPRRKLLLGLGALFAAPAIVRASSLMPVKAYAEEWRVVTTHGTGRVVWESVGQGYAIWDRALTDQEIKALANGAQPGFVAPANLAYWAPYIYRPASIPLPRMGPVT